MPILKSHPRRVYEYQLGYALGFKEAKHVRADQWKRIEKKMKAFGLGMTAENLRFIAQIKARCPRHDFEKEAMEKAIAVAAELGEKAIGVDIKRKVLSRNPELALTRFYWIFRSRNMPFREDSEYEVSLLGEILYMLFLNRGYRFRARQN
jgi:hypothetical protein